MARKSLLIITLLLAAATTATVVSTRKGETSNSLLAGVEESRMSPSAGDAAAIGGKFSLTDQHGKRFTDEQLKGKPSLVFFGFTNCPDICPNTLGLLTEAMDSLPKGSVEKFNVVFISVDPERDTPERLKEYLQQFDIPVIGLTGTKEEVKAAASAYKVYYARAAGTDPAKTEAYLVNHSGFIYLMSPKGEYLSHFSQESAIEDIINALKKLLADA